ncbi:MAG: glycosyltransferase family 2 protein [Verrucomicrobia bacterium]|jgi:glycosyltransferase involved in cell wall biosynthesis|nr:glycosyltransferase family 2 protein [Verrucomicrobiota bacterium]
MTKLPISVCIVSGAEAHRIGKTLESVAGWVSEIVVVLDDRAQDGTDKVVERFGGKVFREAWKGFIGQKNSAAQKCSQPWLLNLDADEVVSQSLQEELRKLFTDSTRLNASAAYQFPRCTFYCGRWIRHGDWYPDRVLRLWRHNAARWVGEEPHARLEVQGRTGTLQSDLLHESNESIARHVAKIIPYQQGFVEARLAEGKSAGIFELCVRPAWRFLRAYIFRMGFLDGWPGLYIAGLNAFSTLTRYSLVKEQELRRQDAE